MSQTVRNAEMLEETDKTGPVLEDLLNQVQEQARMLEDPPVCHKEDLFKDKLGEGQCKIVDESLQLANTMLHHAPPNTEPGPPRIPGKNYLQFVK